MGLWTLGAPFPRSTVSSSTFPVSRTRSSSTPPGPRSLPRARRSTVEGPSPIDDVIGDASARVRRRQRAFLRPVVNATGVLLHTNLGRAPIGEAALADALAIGRGVDEPGVRPRRRRTRVAPRPRRRTPRGRVRCRSGPGRQQQRGRGAADVGGTGARARGARVAWRTGRDRRRVPRPRDHGRVRLPSRRGRHDEPHPQVRLRRGDHPRRGARPEGARVELPHGRIHGDHPGRGAGDARRARRGRRRFGAPRRHHALAGAPAGLAPRRTRGPPGARGGRGGGHVLGRQAARVVHRRGSSSGGPTSWRRSRVTRWHARRAPTS